jgi:glc operon protein GlcG
MMKTSRILLASAFTFCAVITGAIAASAPPPVPAPPSVLPPPSITLAEARAIIDGAIGYARAHNALMAVTVVDIAGNPIASERMDGVSPNNMQYAEGKAFAAAMQRQTTEQLGNLAKDRPDRYFGIMAMYPGKMYLVGGGEPLIVNGVLMGAVGVAGLAQFEDEAAGRAGMAAWQRGRANDSFGRR